MAFAHQSSFGTLSLKPVLMTIKAKATRRLIIVATVCMTVGVIVGGWFVYREIQISRQFARFKADGLAAANQGNNAKAQELLYRYINRNPNDLDAWAAYTRVRPLVSMPDRDAVVDQIYLLRHLLKLSPPAEQKAQAERQLLDLFVKREFWVEASALADNILPSGAKPTPLDAPVLAAKTKARLFGLRNPAQALPLARQWSELAPSDLEAQVLLLACLEQTQDFTGFSPASPGQKPTVMDVATALATAAQKELTRVAPATGDDPRPHLIRELGLRCTGQFNAAIGELRHAADLHPTDRFIIEQLVREFDILGQSDASLEMLKRLQGQTHDPALPAILAKRSWEGGNWQSVVDFTAALDAKDSKSDVELLAMRASALTALKRDAEAAAVRQSLGRRNDPAAGAWLAVISPSSPGHVVSPSELARLCEEASKNRSSAYITEFLGEAYSRLGEANLAVASWQKSAELSRTWSVPSARTAELLCDQGRYAGALQAAREAARRAPRNYNAELTLARAWDLSLHLDPRDRPDQLLLLITQIEKSSKAEGRVLCLKADVLAITGHPRDATTAIQAALDDRATPLSHSTLLQLAAISRNYKLGTEQACLARDQAENGLTAELAYAKAIDQLVAGHAADGLNGFESNRAKATSPDTVQWKLAWARYLDLVGDSRAQNETIRLGDGEPGSVEVQTQAVAARSTRQDRDFLDRSVERLRKLTGEQGVAWRVARARWLLAFADGAQGRQTATDLLNEVLRIAPDSVDAHVLLADCAERAGLTSDAVEQMKAATGLNPASVPLGLRLARLLQVRGDFDAAREELTRLRALPAIDPAERRNAAILAAQLGDPSLALTLAQDAAGGHAGADGEDLLLAKMYWLSGKPQEAQRICAKLLEQPAPPENQLAVIQFAAELYGLQGRLDEANQLLSRLDSLALKPGLRELTRGDFAMQFVGAANAIKYFKQATEAAQSNPLTWQALISSYVMTGQATEALATLTKALEHVPDDPALKTLQKAALVLAEADANAELRPFAVAFARNPGDAAAAESLRTLTAQLASRPTPTALAAAAKTLADKYPQSRQLQFYLAACQLRANQTDEAIYTATHAAERFADAVEPEILLVAILRDQHRWDEVLAEAQKWRQRAAANPLAADLQIAEAEIQLRRPADAAKQLDPYIQNAKSAPKAYQEALPLYAAASKAAGNSGTAELLEPLLQEGARGRQAWMLFAVQNLEPSQAVTWLERVDKLIPPQATNERILLSQMWALLNQRHPDTAFLQKAMEILKPLTEKADADVLAVTSLGMQEEAMGNLGAAAEDYRRAIKMAPNNVIAKNNLAMVLAHQGGDMNEALALAQSAVQVQPDVASLYDTLAFVQGKMRNFEQAITNARKATALQPRAPQFRVTLAQLLLDSGKRSEALQALRDLDSLHLDESSQSPELRQQIQSIRSAALSAGTQASMR